MEIYKLTDEIPRGNPVDLTKKHKRDVTWVEALESVGVSGGVLRITDIRQGVKNPNRVNVFVNGKYAFSLDIAQVVDLKIKVGLEISEEKIEDYKKASEFGKLYQRALEWVLMRPRSEKEVYDYLYKKVYEKKIDKKSISVIVCRLRDKNYIDDEKFAKYYVENRFAKKGISRKRLKMELMKKGVETEIIERVLDGRNDEEEILKIIVKKRAKYDDEKLISYLCRQGFPYQLAQNLVVSHGKD